MSLRSRIAGLAVGTLGLTIMLVGPGSSTAQAQSGPCIWNEGKKDWDYPPEGSDEHCANDSYSVGLQEGYVGTRGAILKDGHPTWADYSPDQYTMLGDRKVFLGGVPSRVIGEAVGDLEGAVVLSGVELNFGLQSFSALKAQYDGKYELVTKSQYLSAKRLDKNNGEIQKRSLSPRTLVVMVYYPRYTEPGTDAVLGEFNFDPSQSVDPGHTNYLVLTKDASAGTIRDWTRGPKIVDANGVLEEGTIAYLSAFFSETEGQTRAGFCKDYNGNAKNGGLWSTEPINGVPNRDDVGAFAACDAWRVGTLWGPMRGAFVDAGGRWMLQGHGVPTAPNGGYQMEYMYIRNSSFWDTMYVHLNYQPVDPRARLLSRFLIRKRVQAGATMEAVDINLTAATSSLVGVSGGTLGAAFGLSDDGMSVDTHKPRSVNFPVEVSFMSGYIGLVNDLRPGIPTTLPATNINGVVNVNENDQEGDDGRLRAQPPHYSHADPSGRRDQVQVDAATGKIVSGGGAGGAAATGGNGGANVEQLLVRRVEYAGAGGAMAAGGNIGSSPNPTPTPDGTPNPVYDDGLLVDIGRSDFANTDIHVFGPSGDLITTRIGLRQGESPGLECTTPPIDDPTARPRCIVSQANPQAIVPFSDFIRNRYPGARYKVIAVNRSTGYMGTGSVRIQDAGTRNGLDAFDIEGSQGSKAIRMQAPNLKVEIKRLPSQARVDNDLCRSLAPGEDCQQIIGFEGGGLSDDVIMVTTEWLDWDGSPLPNDLPGFTARLSRVVGGVLHASTTTQGLVDPNSNQGFGNGDDFQAGDLSHFQIRPNRHLQIVRMPNTSGEAYHYYLHVSGANGDRCGKAKSESAPLHESWEWFTDDSPACASFAKDIDAEFKNTSDQRPARYVPIKVPVFDAATTAAVLDQEIKSARESASGSAAPVTLPTVKPIYTYVYRPEAQFTLYDLQEFQSPQVITQYDSTTGQTRTSLSFDYHFSNTDGESPLSPLGSSKDPVWSLGFDELVATVGGNDKASWDDLEGLSNLSPADQLARLPGLANQLSPSNFLALQLYLANDRGNPLYQDIDIPYLLKMDAAPITLTRRENLGTFATEATLPPVLEAYRPIPFVLLRDAVVSVTAINPAGDSLPLVRAGAPTLAGLHYYVLDGSQLTTLAIDQNFTLRFEAALPKVNGQAPSQFGSHVVDIQVRRSVLRSNRAVGEIVEHDVNILDGSLRLSRQDFSLPGLGPTLSLGRTYSNLLGDSAALRDADSEGDLGPGWSHSLNLQLSPLASGQIGSEAVPGWVGAATTKGINDPADIESHLVEEAQGIGAVSVNGATFIKVNGAWVGERGRQAKLIEEAGCSAAAPRDCFQYVARDGTRYFYDYPLATAPPPGSPAPAAATIVDPTGLSQRLGQFVVANPGSATSSPGSGPSAVSVNRIEDRFANQMQFHYRTDDGRLESVEDAAHRICSFSYESDKSQPGAPPSALPDCDEEQLPAFRRLRSVTCFGSTPEALQVNYCYDKDGNLARVSRQGGKEQEHYEYQDKGGVKGAGSNLWKVSDARGSTRTFNYIPGRGILRSGFDPALQFHKEDMVESIVMPPTEGVDGVLQPVVHFWYGPQSCASGSCTPDKTRTVTDPRERGLKKVYTLNQRGNPIQIDEPKGKYTTLVWSDDDANAGCGDGAPAVGHALMQRTVFRGDRLIVSRFGYDAQGNITSECGPGGYTQTWYHPSSEPNSGFGLLESHTDFHGVRQEWHYDAKGFLLEHIVDAGRDNLTTQYAPDPDHRGRVKQEIVKAAEGDRVTTFDYDNQGNLKSARIEGVSGSLLQTQYDVRGRLELSTDRKGAVTHYHYDTDDHVGLIELPTGVTTAGVDHIATSLVYHYDAAGNLSDQTDRNGLTFKYEYTAQNQVKKVTRVKDVEDQVSRLIKYDELGNVVSEEDWAHKATTHTYDDLGFRETTTDRVGANMVAHHDLLGNVTALTEFGTPQGASIPSPGLKTVYTYDDLNREHTATPQCSDPDCVVRTTEYDLPNSAENLPGARYVVKVTDGGKTFRTGFDARGLEVASKDPKGGLYQSQYDELGRLRKTVDEASFATQFDYDPRGYLKSSTLLGTRGTGNIQTVVEPDNNGNPHVVRRRRVADDAQTESIVTTDFDAWNRPTSRTFAGAGVASLSESLVYDGNGNLVEHTDTAGRGRLWHRDARGQLRSYENAEGETRVYENFDANGNAKLVRDARLIETTLSYDDEERVSMVWEGSNHPGEDRKLLVTERDGLGNPRHITDFRQNDHEFTYSSRHRLASEKRPGKPAIQYSYTPTGRLDKVLDARGFTRKFSYDGLDRVQDTCYPTLSDTCNPSQPSFESHTEYNAVGKVTLQENRSGSVVENTYDDFLRVHFVDRYLAGGGAATRALIREYDDRGNVTSETDASNVTVRYAYNNFNQLERTVYAPISGEGELTRSEVRSYYPSGALRAVTLPHDPDEAAFTTTYGYDREDRLTSMQAAGQATSYRYDKDGNLATIIKPENQDGSQPSPGGGTFSAGKFAGKFRTFKYDALNRLAQVTDEVGLSTKYSHDAASNLTDVYGPYLADAWATAPHVHNDIDPLVDRVTERTQGQAFDPPVVTTFSEYDADDNVTTLVDPLRRTFHYSYDHYDRLTHAGYQDDPATPFYRPQSVDIDINDVTNVTTITESKVDETGATVTDTTVEQRDRIFDRVLTSTQRGVSVVYDYFANGNRKSVSTASGSTSYSYDARNRLQQTTVNGAVTSYQYHQDGRVKAADLGNGAGTSYGYGADLRISDISHDFAATSRKLHYDYDKNGNTTLATDKTFQAGDPNPSSTDATSFDEYDAADRLVQFTQDGNVTRYGYERYNRKTETVTGRMPAAKIFEYDPLSERLKKITDSVSNTIVNYDSDLNGNVKARTTQPANTVEKFDYDVLNQLKRVTRGPPGDTVLGKYDYDAAGRRVRQADTDRGNVASTYDGISVLEEALSGTGATLHNHYDGSRLLAQTKDGQDSYFHQDKLGSTFNQSNASATPSGDYKYDPFGGVRVQPQAQSGITFTGQQHDQSTGLYYYGARFYDPAVGRFLTEDTWAGSTAQPESLQKFLYAYSNPARFTDPTGHAPAGFPGDFGPPDVDGKPAEGTWTKTTNERGDTAYTYQSPPQDGHNDRLDVRVDYAPRDKARHAPRNRPSPRALPLGYIVRGEDLRDWYGMPQSRERAEQYSTAEDDAARQAEEASRRPVESFGDKAWGFSTGFATGFGAGLATSFAIGAAEAVVGLVSVSAAAFVAPVAITGLVLYGAYELFVKDNGAGADAIGTAVSNTLDGDPTAQDLNILGTLAGGFASGKFAKPAGTLGRTATEAAIGEMRSTFGRLRGPPIVNQPILVDPQPILSERPQSWEDFRGRAARIQQESRLRYGDPETEVLNQAAEGGGTVGAAATLEDALAAARARSGVARGPQGGTIAVGSTDVPGLEDVIFEGASPKARPGTPSTQGPIRSPRLNPLLRNHAEEGLANAVDKALSNPNVDPASLAGRTLRVLVEQEVCSACRQGFGKPGVPPGVLMQLSLKYPLLRIEVAAQGTDEVLLILGGKRIQ